MQLKLQILLPATSASRPVHKLSSLTCWRPVNVNSVYQAPMSMGHVGKKHSRAMLFANTAREQCRRECSIHTTLVHEPCRQAVFTGSVDWHPWTRVSKMTAMLVTCFHGSVYRAKLTEHTTSSGGNCTTHRYAKDMPTRRLDHSRMLPAVVLVVLSSYK